MSVIRVVHYVNQFHGHIGGEDKADLPPQYLDGPVGVGKFIEQQSDQRFQVVRTIICGDNYAGENLEKVANEVFPWIEEVRPELFLAGPSFGSGR